MKAGAVSFLVKPVSMKDVIQAIEKVIIQEVVQ